jgi:glycosyltransferase involved in cell wall biosynthesis
MEILITTGIFPPDIGGPATYVPTIAKALAERGHQVTVLTTSEPENLQWDDSIYPFFSLPHKSPTKDLASVT